MLFPIGDDQIKGGHFPLFSYGFIALNIVVFIYEMSLDPQAFNNLIYNFGAIPNELTSGGPWWPLFTSMFLHGDIMHLVGNMVFLWIFADNIEAVIGNVRFLIFYLLGGLAAHALHIFISPGSVVPTVGASGAISAVMGAYLVMFPSSRIKVLFLSFFMRVPAFVFLGIWILQQSISGTQSLQTATTESGGVAWWAHIGGFAAGILAGLIFTNRYRGPVLESDLGDRYL